MHRSEKRTIRIVASLSMALGACREGTAPMSPSFSGDYTVSVARFPAACTPQSLPEPVSTDTSQYADVPTRRTLTDAAFRVNVVNSSISIAGLDDNGRPDPMRTSAGTIVGDIPAATSVTSRSVPSRREGLRQGDHTFYVSESLTDSTQFIAVVASLPPSHGDGIQANEFSSGTDVLVFRDGGPSGPIFTSCVVSDSTSGTRESP